MRSGTLAALHRAASREVVQLGLTSWQRIAMVAVLPAYGSVLLVWYFFGWGGPELHQSIAPLAFVPVLLFVITAAFRASRVATSPATRRAWAFVGLGFSAYGFGNMAWFWIGAIQGQEVPFPSIADVGFLAFFPLVLLGLGLLPRERPGGTLRSVLDMALVMVGAGVLVWWAVPLGVSAFFGNDGDRVLVAGAIVATALVVVRQVHTARQNASLMSQRASDLAAARFQALIKNASDVILVTDAAGRISFATPSAEPLFKRDLAVLENSSITELLNPAEAPMVRALLTAAAQRPGISGPLAFEVAGAERWVEMRVSNLLDDSLVSGLVATIHDITERRAFEQQLASQALHDPLTGLANRVLFADRVEQSVVRARRSRRPPAVLYLDLDDFKRINDTLGHAAGDEVLVEVARRIRSTIRGEDTAARLGGDEFSILVEETRSVDEAVALASRMAAAFSPPFDAAGSSFSLDCTIGIHRSDRGGASAGDLLRNADIAMYAAKRDARGGHLVFQEAMYAETVDRVRMDADIREALDRGQLRLAYQPIVLLSDGELSGVEALLRWDHPARGLVMPMEFIPLAERSGEIRRIGRWVLEQACRTTRGWSAVSGKPLKVNVNVSVVQLEPDFVAEVASILADTGLPASQLVIEITESVFSEHRAEVVGILTELRRLGIRISIDDFGTGYSSLSRLRDLPVDELKVDRSFVSQLGGQVDGSLVATILHLAQELSLGTVAEGVEEVAQMDRLRELGCDQAQGYLIGRPGEPEIIERMLLADHPTLMLPAA